MPFHEIRYSWNFGETANNPAYNATWAYGTRPGANSKDLASGPVAAHVFETPGTYTVSLTGFDGTNTSTRTTTVTVTDPNTVFSNNTIYVSQSGVPVPGQNGVPPGANVQQVTSWPTIASLASTYKRVLLKRGDTWQVNGTATFGASQNGQGTIGAYGFGNKPIIDVNTSNVAFHFLPAGNDWRLVDLDIQASPATYNMDGKGILAMGSNLLLLRTEVKRTGRILVETQTANGLYIVDSIIGPANFTGAHSILNYVFNSQRVALLGSRFTQSNDHTVRWQGAALSVVDNVTMDTPRATSAVLTIRGMVTSANSSIWTGTWTENIVVTGSVLDGSTGSLSSMHAGPQNNQSAERCRNVLVQGNRIRGGGNYHAVHSKCATGFALYNNIIETRYWSAVWFSTGSDIASNPKQTQATMYNNTIYKTDTSLTPGFSAVRLTDDVSGIVIKNNIAYAPGNERNGATDNVGATFLQLPNSPTLLEGVNYVLSHNSTNYQVNTVRPWSSTNPMTNLDFAPTGAYATSVGDNIKIWDDFTGTLNATPKYMGALNP